MDINILFLCTLKMMLMIYSIKSKRKILNYDYKVNKDANGDIKSKYYFIYN